ncbi:hypothetical protein OSTOST_04088 [Ostertagia ostertagi]
MKRIADDIGVNFSNTNAPPDILDMRIFMEKLHSIPIPDLRSLLESNNFYNASSIMNLSQVDATVHKLRRSHQALDKFPARNPSISEETGTATMVRVGMEKATQKDIPHCLIVNWTQYLLLVAPPTAHYYIILDPWVAVPSNEYMERLNQVLNETSPRTITNYVMVQYILSWLPLLEKKYSDLLNWFKSMVDGTVPPQNRSEACFVETQKHYKVAMLAMYARFRSTQVLRQVALDMVKGIIEGLKEEIRENKWMDEKFKKAVLEKVNLISWSLLDDHLFYNDSALDMLYAAHSSLVNRPFLDMLDEVALLEKIDSFNAVVKMTSMEELRAVYRTFSKMGYQVNAYYMPSLNNISRRFDGKGVERDWWKGMDKTVQRKGRVLCGTVRKSENSKIQHVSEGRLTLAENTADNEGLKISYRHLAAGKLEPEKLAAKEVASSYVSGSLHEVINPYEAYRDYVAKQTDAEKIESVDGFTSDHLFFLGSASLWCRKTAEFTLYEGITQEHTPSEYVSHDVVDAKTSAAQMQLGHNRRLAYRIPDNGGNVRWMAIHILVNRAENA